MEEIRAMHQNDEPVPPSERLGREIPADFEALLIACLAKKPEARPRSAQALSEALTRCASFGAWTPQLAKQWWSNNWQGLPTEEPGKDRSLIPDTQLRVDMEARVQSNA